MTQQDITNFISKSILDGQPVAPGDELLISGILDSLGVMTLVAHLETELQIQIPTEQITFENFSSVDHLSAFLKTL